ncbi:hypothetical protein MBLNU230_g1182t1 [Neophaeotheca triangularis]
MPPIPGMMHWHSLLARHAKDLRVAFQKASRALDAKLTGKAQAQLEPVLVRSTPKQPLHPLARIRQSQSRWYSTARNTVRNFSSAPSKHAGVKYDRASFPTSRVGAHIASSSGRAPFASTLRPNLTGGTLGRTAGGYATGSGRIGGQRFFSHGPASQAQVVQNVSQAVRAFFVGGQKAQFDGMSTRTGEKRYKAVSAVQEEAGRKMKSVARTTPGSWVDFPINPTVTAFTPLAGITGFSNSNIAELNHLNTDGLLDVLSVDFSRALKDLAGVLNDLNKLSALGDLPITYQDSSLRVHFPGCDVDTVERLCQELNVQRGTVVQDEAFDSSAGTEIALLFPFAPSARESECESLFVEEEPSWPCTKRPVISMQDMMTSSQSPAYSSTSDHVYEEITGEDWLSPESAYESVHSDSESSLGKYDPLEYQGLEGIYRFIEQCDSVGRRR